MSDVTDADREKAFRVLGWHESWGLADLSADDRNEVEDIAVALAEERAKARAVFLRLAAELEQRDLQRDSGGEVAWLIREAAGETE